LLVFGKRSNKGFILQKLTVKTFKGGLMFKISLKKLTKCLVNVSAAAACVLLFGCGPKGGGEDDERNRTEPDVEVDTKGKSSTELISLGSSSLKSKKYDEAIAYYEAAFVANNNDTKAIIYSVMAKIAKISTDPKVVDLFKNRFGFSQYPNRLNALLSDDWLKEYPSKYRVWSYYDDNIEKWVYWYDDYEVNSSYYPDITKVGYYSEEYGYDYETGEWWSTHTFVTSERRYDEGEYYSRLPELVTPAWIVGGSDSWYNETLMSNKAHSISTWALLLFANAVDKNTAGLNDVLDELISSVFGGSFVDACDRLKRLENNKNSLVTLDRDFIEALYLDEIIDEYDLIGWPEVNAIISSMICVKASLEWVAAYDWNTNLNFLKYSWKSDGNDFQEHFKNINAKDLPFNNSFLNARPGKMAVAKADFIKAIEGIKASYDAIRNSDLYPTEE